MSALGTPQIATRFGALDDAAFADGYSVPSHLLRVMAMVSNRLVSQQEPVFNLVWDSSTDTVETTVQGALMGFAYPVWCQVVPTILCPKRPGLTTIDVKIIASITSGQTCYAQIATHEEPFDDSAPASATNVLTMAGTGAFATYTLTGVRIDPGLQDWIGVYIKGTPTSTNGVVVPDTYGTPNSGTVTASAYNYFEDAAALWNTGGGGGSTWDDGGHYVRFEDTASGVLVETPRLIVQVPSATRIEFHPPLSTNHVLSRLAGTTYRIRQLPEWRICNVAGYAAARTA